MNGLKIINVLQPLFFKWKSIFNCRRCKILLHSKKDIEYIKIKDLLKPLVFTASNGRAIEIYGNLFQFF